MKALYPNQPINYVNAEGAIVTATIAEPQGASHAIIQVGPNHTAHAAFNEDEKTPNTFHFPPEPDSHFKSEAPAEPAKTFKPGSKARSDKPQNGAVTRPE